MNRFSRNYTESEELTPRSSPAASDESLRDHEIYQHPRVVSPDRAQIDGYRQMRVAMVQTAAGLKPPSGGFRGNYATLFALAKHGHTTMQFCWAYKKDINSAVAELKAEKKFQDSEWTWGSTYMLDTNSEQVKVTWWKFKNVHDVLCVALDAEVMIPTYPNNIQQEDAATWIETGERPARAQLYADWIADHLTKFETTHVIFNDAFANVVTAEMPALREKAARIEVIHTLEQLPAGPYAGGISGGAKTQAELPLFKELDGLVAVSKAVQKYAKDHCGLDSEMIPNHAWSYKDKDTGDWPRYRHNFAKQTVAMVNPAFVKGYEIFLGMARENKQRVVENNWDELLNRPVYNFVAYISWGTDPDMIKDLQAAGVKTLDPVTDMEPAFDNISVLIVPSLWQEAWGLVATEAQLRGIPVIASDVGGLAESKRYVGPLLQVNKVCGTKRNTNGNYIIPQQDIGPWMRELDLLLTDKDRYEASSHMSYYTTRQWIRQFDVRGMEKYLLSLAK
ncbi:hypothetical protein OHC33_010893 [Knufia fluminis]|uniref:Glycosyl transferase family 1 domain-containing protein n=1 Tax=Knufia fluminis TaxID=191047 RepID=A0AAN8IHI4_9EURO|nr:hypothetical protein OHC33_010893 [Knufia fluminis]